MKIITVTFDYRGKSDYARLMAVFKASCAKVMPAVTFEEHRLPPPASIKPGYSQGCCSNTHKLRHWVRVMETATETVCFADCDMLALRSIEDAEELDFDLAYTKRTSARIPNNGGVVFVRPTEAGRACMARWLELNEAMFINHTLHEFWRRKFAGMNQAAFGCLLSHHRTKAKMLPIPCAQWNACNEDWRFVPANSARLVHLKGDLRRALLGNVNMNQVLPAQKYIVGEWRKYGK